MRQDHQRSRYVLRRLSGFEQRGQREAGMPADRRPPSRLGRHRTATNPCAHFLDPTIRPLAEHIRHALDRGPLPEPQIPALDAEPQSLFCEAAAIENGFAQTAYGAIIAAARTDLPRATPAMIDCWRSDSPEQYKLWHPFPAASEPRLYRPEPLRSRAGDRRVRANGARRCSDRCLPCAPCPPDRGRQRDALALLDCGHYAAARNSVLGTVMARAAGLIMWPTESDARALLVHRAEEMQHLARFAPALYAEFRLDKQA